MEDKKKSPALRFTGFIEDWGEYKLQDVCESFEYGLNAAAKGYDGVNKYLRITDIDEKSRGFILNGVTSPDCELENADGFLLKDGDILFARTGASVGKTYLYRPCDGIVYFAGFLIRGRVKQEFSAEMVFQYTLTNNYMKYIHIASQRSGQPGVNAQEYSAFPIRLPKAKNEQQQIGSFFKNIDELINKHQKKHTRLVTLKKSMLEKMFPKEGQTVPDIRFKGFEGDWGKDELHNFGKPYTGLSGKSKKDFGHGEAKYITYMNVFSNSIADPSLTGSIELDNTQNCVEYGDVLFTVSSETPEEVGLTSVWTQKEKNVYLNSFCFGYRPSRKFDVTFLANALRSCAFRKKITLLGQGISRFNISKTKVMNLDLCFPDYDEQVKIGLYFKDLEGLIFSHKKQLKKLNNFKQSLSEKMFV